MPRVEPPAAAASTHPSASRERLCDFAGHGPQPVGSQAGATARGSRASPRPERTRVPASRGRGATPTCARGAVGDLRHRTRSRSGRGNQPPSRAGSSFRRSVRGRRRLRLRQRRGVDQPFGEGRQPSSGPRGFWPPSQIGGPPGVRRRRQVRRTTPAGRAPGPWRVTPDVRRGGRRFESPDGA